MEIKLLIVGELATNCYLLVSEKEAAIIDPGGEAEKILEELKKTNAKPKYIINTHYHPDHSLANEKLRQETGAEILIHEKEKNFLGSEINRSLKDGDEIKIGKIILKVIHSPGHTQGSICLEGPSFIFTGDTLFKDGWGRTDLPGGSDQELKESLEKLEKLCRPGIFVCPGHGDIFRVPDF